MEARDEALEEPLLPFNTNSRNSVLFPHHHHNVQISELAGSQTNSPVTAQDGTSAVDGPRVSPYSTKIQGAAEVVSLFRKSIRSPHKNDLKVPTSKLESSPSRKRGFNLSSLASLWLDQSSLTRSDSRSTKGELPQQSEDEVSLKSNSASFSKDVQVPQGSCSESSDSSDPPTTSSEGTSTNDELFVSGIAERSSPILSPTLLEMKSSQDILGYSRSLLEMLFAYMNERVDVDVVHPFDSNSTNQQAGGTLMVRESSDSSSSDKSSWRGSKSSIETSRDAPSTAKALTDALLFVQVILLPPSSSSLKGGAEEKDIRGGYDQAGVSQLTNNPCQTSAITLLVIWNHCCSLDTPSSSSLPTECSLQVARTIRSKSPSSPSSFSSARPASRFKTVVSSKRYPLFGAHSSASPITKTILAGAKGGNGVISSNAFEGLRDALAQSRSICSSATLERAGYRYKSTLGFGATAVVYEVVNIDGNGETEDHPSSSSSSYSRGRPPSTFAAKAVDSAHLQRFNMERKILNAMENQIQGLPHLHEVLEETLTIITSPVGTGLNRLPWGSIRNGGVFVSIVRALQALADKGYLHRDVSPGNLILDPSTNELVLIDFGMALEMIDPTSSSRLDPHLYSGSRYFASDSICMQLIGDDSDGDNEEGERSSWHERAVVFSPLDDLESLMKTVLWTLDYDCHGLLNHAAKAPHLFIRHRNQIQPQQHPRSHRAGSKSSETLNFEVVNDDTINQATSKHRHDVASAQSLLSPRDMHSLWSKIWKSSDTARRFRKVIDKARLNPTQAHDLIASWLDKLRWSQTWVWQ